MVTGLDRLDNGAHLNLQRLALGEGQVKANSCWLMQGSGLRTNNAKQGLCICQHVWDLGMAAGLVEKNGKLPYYSTALSVEHKSQGWARPGQESLQHSVIVCVGQVWG